MKRQVKQDNMYTFPYHYLIEFDSESESDFNQFKSNSGGYRYAAYLIKVLRELKLLNFNSLIDVGCGDGYFLNKLSKKNISKNLLGIDISPKGINQAKVMNSDLSIEFICRDIVDFSINDKKFDVATSIAVLEHIPPNLLNEHLRAISDILVEDGSFLIVVPSVHLDIKKITRHYQHFSLESIKKLIEPHFRILKMEYICKTNFVWRLWCYIWNNSFFTITHQKTINIMFKYYLKNLLENDSPKGFEIFIHAKKY